MKKIMLSLAMALVSVCASAQVYIGGTAGSKRLRVYTLHNSKKQ